MPPMLARRRAAILFHALSDETRLGILDQLRHGEQCVCTLQDAADAAQSRLSYHLRVLKDAGLVRDRKDGRWSYYSLVPETLIEAHDAVSALTPRTLLPARAARPARRTLPAIGACCG